VRTFTGLTISLVLLAGCGGGDDLDCVAATAKPALNPTATVISLSADQRAQLCDLLACGNDGYGHQLACQTGEASFMFVGSQGQCLSRYPTNPACRATVKDMMDCHAAVRANPCSSTFFGGPACEEVTAFECLTFRPNGAVGMLSPVRPPRP